MKGSPVLSLGDDEITAANAASLSNKLTQMANGAVYGDCGKVLSIHDRQPDALEDIIESMNGIPLLVTYWYKHDLTRIEQRLRERNITFEKLNNEQAIRRWNEQKIPVALIHPASAGHDLNLQQGGSTLVWFGLTRSLDLYSQTNARLYRQGQKSTVVIQHIVTENTIDERILKALKTKEQTQTALPDAVKKEIRKGGKKLMTAKEYLEQIYLLDDKINSDLRELRRMHDRIPLAREGRMTLVDEVHHIIPLSRGGDHTSDNLMSLCRSCHNKMHKELGDR